MKTLQLTKQSNESEIKKYFSAVLKLAKSSEEFPVNLDEVWQLVYGTKQKAVNELRNSKNEDGTSRYIEGIDYQSLNQKIEAGHTCSIVHNYTISVSCLEWFIARKVRAVFDVYRKVFHKTAEQAQLNSSNPSVVKTKLIVADWAAKFLNLNDNSKLLLVKSIADPLGLPTPDYTPSKDQLLSATELLVRSGSVMNAREFNQKMIEIGYVEIKQRPSSGGKTKCFKSLTERAKIYGENQVNPSNPKETQPLYYEGRFNDLLAEIKLKQLA